MYSQASLTTNRFQCLRLVQSESFENREFYMRNATKDGPFEESVFRPSGVWSSDRINAFCCSLRTI